MLFLVVSPGFEPGIEESKSSVLPLHYETVCCSTWTRTKLICFKDRYDHPYTMEQNVVVLLGLEPRIEESKSSVLPLHYKTIKKPYSIRLNRVCKV